MIKYEEKPNVSAVEIFRNPYLIKDVIYNLLPTLDDNYDFANSFLGITLIPSKKKIERNVLRYRITDRYYNNSEDDNDSHIFDLIIIDTLCDSVLVLLLGKDTFDTLKNIMLIK